MYARVLLLCLFLVVMNGMTAGFQHATPLSTPCTLWPPSGIASKFPVTRDTVISSAHGEERGNNGSAALLKLKGILEYDLFDIDASALKGRIITGALLHVRSASPESPFARVGISTVAAEWTEGTSAHYIPQTGSACFEQAGYRTRDWAYPGSNILDVVFSRGHTLWKFADCSPPDANGWQACAVDPDVVAARAAGLSHGFLLFDEVGHIWSLKKGAFNYTWFPNRFCYSRESKANAPWMEIWTNGADAAPPGTVDTLETETSGLPAGQAVVGWKTPQDGGGGKTLGFLVGYTLGGAEREFPEYLVPMAGPPGENVRMHIRDMPFGPGEPIGLTIRAVDSAGNIGLPFTSDIRLSPSPASVDLPEADIAPFRSGAALPAVAGIKLSVVDLLDKIDPRTGAMIPLRGESYKSGNHLFSAKDKLIRLQSARNETVAFQLNMEGAAPKVSIDCSFDDGANLHPKIYQFGYVNAVDKHGTIRSVLPDPLLEMKGGITIPSNPGIVPIAGQTNTSFICELYVPHEEAPGHRKGRLTVSAGTESVELDVDLTVWNFTLPDKLSFIPEMNAYGTVSPFKGYDYYRLAHEHRTCLNRLPYGWNGLPEYAPAWDGARFDWSEWDRNVGPILDGSAFEGLPRSGEPVDAFYLPFSENWPIPVCGHYTPSYWADDALDDRYAAALGGSFAAFARHCNEKGWQRTVFQFYLNNKIYYRKDFAHSSAPWVLDEPIHTQDFWALRWYGILWHRAVDPVKGGAMMWYRADVSFSQFERDILQGITDIEYLGGNNLQKTRMKHDEQILHGTGRFAEYGTVNDITSPNHQPVLWCMAAWTKGAAGVLPWQTIGSTGCWTNAERTALFYPHPDGPKPSVRLKAFTRGQQDVEYVNLFCDTFGRRNTAIQEIHSRFEGLDTIYAPSADASGYSGPDITELWNIRYRLGRKLSSAAPVFKRQIERPGPAGIHGHPSPMIGYVTMSPGVERLKPDCDPAEFQCRGN